MMEQIDLHATHVDVADALLAQLVNLEDGRLLGVEIAARAAGRYRLRPGKTFPALGIPTLQFVERPRHQQLWRNVEARFHLGRPRLADTTLGVRRWRNRTGRRAV